MKVELQGLEIVNYSTKGCTEVAPKSSLAKAFAVLNSKIVSVKDPNNCWKDFQDTDCA